MNLSSIPLLTIGMPIYNGGAELAKVLDNILAQSFQDFQIIISNNASKDDTAAICDQYAKKDARITVYHQERTINPTQNFCFVLNKANTLYFAWAAHDDMRDSDYFEKLVATLNNDGNAILAFGDILQVSPETGETEMLTTDFVQKGKSTLSRMWWAATNQMHHLYGVWRSDAIRRIVWKHSIWSHDTALMIAATSMGQFAYCKGVKLHYLDNRHPFLPKK